MSLTRRALSGVAVAAVMLLLTAAPARANTITVQLAGGSPFACDGVWCWEYQIAVDDISYISSGAAPGAVTPVHTDPGVIADYFTVFDFYGFTGVVTTPVNWAFQSLNIGSRPSNVIVTDDAAVPNLTWYYTGPRLEGPLTIGGFIARSIYSTPNPGGEFGSEDHAVADDLTNQARGFVPVPQQVVPEPGSMFLFGMGLLGLAGVVRRRRQQ
jgi:hypothetical protein